MTMTRRLWLTIVLMVSMVLAGCFGSSSLIVDWTDADILISDHYDIPAGNYTVPYSIDDIIDLAGDYDVDITWSITTDEGLAISHVNNQFTVVEGVTYEVHVEVSIQDGLYVYEKTITVEAATPIVTITWDHNLTAGTQATLTDVEVDTYTTALVAPTQSGYIFLGWFASLTDTEPFNFSTTRITRDMTLYAKWEIAVTATAHPEYFDWVILKDSSFIHDGEPYQHMKLESTLLYDDFDLAEEFDESGMIYSTSSDLSWGNELVKTSDEPDPYSPHYGYVHLESISLPLEDVTMYYARPYVRYDHNVYYGEVVFYVTDHLVGSGQSVGLSSHVSGGTYRYDLGSIYYASGTFIEVAQGYSAKLNGENYQSFSRILNQGTMRLVTIDDATNERYLHVMEWIQRTAPAQVNYSGFTVSTGYINDYQVASLRLSYIGRYYKGETFAFDLDSAGVLFSTSHPYLIRDLSNVYRRPASQVESDGSFVNEEFYLIPLGSDAVYARGYVIEDGRISYSNMVEKFEYGVEGWTRTARYQWETFIKAPNSTHSIYASSTTVTRETTFTPDLSYVDYEGNVDITGPGTKFITSPNSTYLYINEMIFTHDPLIVEGVTEGADYSHPVTINFEHWNVDAYLEFNGNEVNFASGVTLKEAGTYQLKLYHYSGNQVITFTISD